MKRKPITVYAVIQTNLNGQPYASCYHRTGEIMTALHLTRKAAEDSVSLVKSDYVSCYVKEITIY